MENGKQPEFPIDAELNQMSPKGMIPIGLTKREYFAAMAMQGLLAKYGGEMVKERTTDTHGYASLSVIMADALLKELEK